MSAHRDFLEKPAEEKLHILLEAIASGEPREALAQRLGYRSVKSMDSFLRRRDYVWDRYQQCYVEKPSSKVPTGVLGDLPLQPPERVARVIALWKAPGAEAKSVAKQSGFSDHREMAKYMATHGYSWSSQENNYIKTGSASDQGEKSLVSNPPKLDQTVLNEPASFSNYESLLNWLSTHQEALQSMVSLSGDPQFLPRYLVPGVLVTKSIHMSHLLDQLARDYSSIKHVSQREIFEVALIEFFQRHGFHQEIRRLFS